MTERIYIDTSVIGGFSDKVIAEWSQSLFDEIKTGKRIAIVSDLTRLELESAPESVQKVLSDIPDSQIENVFLSDEAEQLAQRYIDSNVTTERHIIDAQHIAVATIEKVDVLVSWNFRDIVNLNRIRAFNSVNLRYGYHMLEIRTPREVLHGTDD